MEYNEIYNNNILGIKPIIQLWNGSVGAYNINNFNISDDTAKLRLISYLNNANGNNTTLYSFYNKKVFLDLLKLSLSHPTRGGYTDWAFVAGLVSSGKILVDSSKLLLYKNTNWFGTQEYINEQDRKLYEKAGLNERLYLFGKLLRALDSFIYVIRKNSPVTREEAIDAAFYIYEVNFKGFLNDIKINNINYNNFEKKISLKIDIASHIEEKLNLTLDVIESLDSELSKKYFFSNLFIAVAIKDNILKSRSIDLLASIMFDIFIICVFSIAFSIILRECSMLFISISINEYLSKKSVIFEHP